LIVLALLRVSRLLVLALMFENPYSDTKDKSMMMASSSNLSGVVINIESLINPTAHTSMGSTVNTTDSKVPLAAAKTIPSSMIKDCDNHGLKRFIVSVVRCDL